MQSALHIDVVTLFPGMLDGFLRESIMGRAMASGALSVGLVNPRDFAMDSHRTADDRPYGGGPGMVMLAEPLAAAIESVKTEGARVALLTPAGRRFDHALAKRWSAERRLVLVCGHYEGVDERLIEALVTDEVSIGDYVLTNGALAAAVLIDAIARLLPGVLGGEGAADADSFVDGLLEYPQYTRPLEFRGRRVPPELLSGNHAAIAQWRLERSIERTRERRPDLYEEWAKRRKGTETTSGSGVE